MASKAIYSVVAVAGIAAAAGGAYWYQGKANKPQEFGANSSTAAGNTQVSAPNSGASAAGGAARGMPGVEVAKVETSRLQDDASAVGSLRSKQNVMLRPEISGRVTALGFSDGGRVRKGDVVLQLDDTLQRAEIRQAQAQLSIAQANLKRNQDLVAQNFVAVRVLDESAATVQVAEAQVALACARWERMKVVAPFDGTVGIRNVNLGDYVKDGADVVNLEDLSSMFVDFRLPERFVGKLRKDQAIEMQLDAMPGRLFKAKIEAIDPQLDANGRAVLVRATLPNTGGEPLVQRPQGGAAGAGGSPGAGGRPGGIPSAAGAKPAVPVAKPAARPPQRPASASAVTPTPRPVDPIAQACVAVSGQSVATRPAGAPGAGAAQGAGRPGGGGAGGAPAGAGGSSRPQAVAAVSGQASPSGRPSGAGGPGGAPGMGGGGGPLRPGMFARVTAVFNVKDTAITIPEEAIVPQGGRQFVIRLIDQTEAQAKEIADKQAADAAKVAAAAPGASAPAAGGAGVGGAGGQGGAQPYPMGGFVDGKRLVSQRVEVKLGIRRPGRVEITEGLVETDTVVVAGQQRVQRDFTPVRVIELGRPPGGGGAPGGAPASGGAPGGANAAGRAITPAPSASAAR